MLGLSSKAARPSHLRFFALHRRCLNAFACPLTLFLLELPRRHGYEDLK